MHNLLNDCTFRLTWKAKYTKNGGKVSWVDAQNGTILKTIEGGTGLSAPTKNYGNVQLDDINVGNLTSLISTGNRVRTYDFGNSGPNQAFVIATEWDASLIPTTTANEWTTSVAPKRVYQAHHVVTQGLPAFSGLGINFGTVNVASSEIIDASANLQATVANAYILLGKVGGTTGLFDVAAHELAHCYLLDGILDYTLTGNRSLHEGLADIFGTYIEFKVQGYVDWAIGDDDGAVKDEIKRNLQNPGNNGCLDNVATSEQHDRGQPLGHWFYLIAQDGGIFGPLGLEKSMEIIVESLNSMGVNDDYEEMRDAVLNYVDAKYGPCSHESNTIRWAWNEICVGPDDPTDCFEIHGPNWVCEENNYLSLWVVNPTPGATYNWTFPFGWTVQSSGPGNPSGNSYQGINLVVTNFPQYNYYPQYFTIYVSSPSSGAPVYTQSKTVTLKDCDHDDPDCASYYGLNGGGAVGDRTDLDSSHKVTKDERMIESVKVFDTMGRLLYSGPVSGFNRNIFSYSGIIVLCYYDKHGLYVKSEKSILTK